MATDESFIIGAYAASPTFSSWNEELEDSYLSQIFLLSKLRGLEIPIHINGNVHRFDSNWFLKKLQSHGKELQLVVTCIPGKNPHFGLASNEENGRQAAIQFIKNVRECVSALNNLPNAKVVAVQIHSAPSLGKIEGITSSKESFSKSLEEICEYNWEGASLIIEHCDAYTKSHVPVKGFLQLQEELEVIKDISKKNSNVQLGIAINWGRSVLEGRSIETPLEHIKQIKEFEKVQNLNILKGLMFSGSKLLFFSDKKKGCSNSDNLYGNWTDSHAPFKPRKDNSVFNSNSSLMSDECAKKCLEIVKKSNIQYVGFKIAPKPEGLSIKERMLYFEEAIDILSTK